jgi:hypothetical protein
MNWMPRPGLLLAAALMPALSGCLGAHFVPTGVGPIFPIPVPPWTAEKFESKFTNQNDFRTPIMPPIRDGFPPPLCEDPPTEREVLRAMPHVIRGCPYVLEEFRDDVKISCERIVDKIDPPRFFPLVGPAQLHHCHWRCTVYYTETYSGDTAFPARIKRRRVQVIYIDKDHLHQYVGPDPDMQRKITLEHVGY